jgi:hypothetical protein
MKGLVPLRGVIVTEASNLSGGRKYRFCTSSVLLPLITLVCIDEHRFGILVKGAERDWKFAAKSKQDMEAWIMAISSCIDHGNADPESSVVTDAPVVVDSTIPIIIIACACCCCCCCCC